MLNTALEYIATINSARGLLITLSLSLFFSLVYVKTIRKMPGLRTWERNSKKIMIMSSILWNLSCLLHTVKHDTPFSGHRKRERESGCVCVSAYRRVCVRKGEDLVTGQLYSVNYGLPSIEPPSLSL